MEKIKVGFFSFTCCEGCILSFVEVLNRKFDEYNKKFDFKHIRILKPSSEKIGKLDIAFIEGAISNKSELKKLKEIRKNSEKIVAIGSGAITGWPSNLSNEFNSKVKKLIKPKLKGLKALKKILPLHKYVKIDDNIEGCPVEENIFIKKIDSYIKEFKNA
jgi:sulfhydrogenase subunit delta